MKEKDSYLHVNQAYNKFVAKSDKVHKRELLGMINNYKHINRGVIDQYGLLHVSLYTIRAMTKRTLTSSFHACNLYTLTRVSFPEWSQSIGSFLQTGQTFKCETLLVNYLLPLSFWHGTTPEDKKIFVGVIRNHGGFTVQCCKDLPYRFHITFVDQKSLRPCYELALQHMYRLDLGVMPPEQVTRAQHIPEIEESYALMNHVTNVLD